MDTADDLIELWKCDIAGNFAFEIVGEAIGQWKRGIAVGFKAFRVGNTVAAVRALSATRGTISAACGGAAAAFLAGSVTCGTISIACGAAGVASQSTATGARRTTTAGCITIPTANCRRNTAAGVSSASVPLGTIA